MELVVRAAVVYVALFVLMRAAGNRQFSELTAFDAVLIIVIAEVTGNALSGNDYSMTTAVVVVLTLVGIDIGVSLVKQRSKAVGKVVDGVPVLLVDEGEVLWENLEKERVDEEDILEAARDAHGLERLDQVKYAMLERSGKISIVPR